MKKLLKRYWLFLLMVVLWTICDFYVLPHQQEVYLPEEFDRVSRNTRNGLLIVDGVLLCLLLIYYIVKRIAGAGGFFTAALLLASFYFGLKDLLIATELFVNQLGTRETVTSAYVVQYMGKGTSERNFCLYDVDSKRLLNDGNLVKAAYKVGLASGDTVYPVLKKGLLNAIYFDQVTVWKADNSRILK